MADEKPTLHIDDDWKKQAQAEKKKLAEESAKSPSPGTPVSSGSQAANAGGPRASAAAAGRGASPEAPQANFATLVQSLLTQILYYLGDLAPRGAQPALNLDMAKHNIDLLTMLEDKTKNNLTEDEKRLLDAALYETRMRYVSVASQFT